MQIQTDTHTHTHSHMQRLLSVVMSRCNCDKEPLKTSCLKELNIHRHATCSRNNPSKANHFLSGEYLKVCFLATLLALVDEDHGKESSDISMQASAGFNIWQLPLDSFQIRSDLLMSWHCLSSCEVWGVRWAACLRHVWLGTWRHITLRQKSIPQGPGLSNGQKVLSESAWPIFSQLS